MKSSSKFLLILCTWFLSVITTYLVLSGTLNPSSQDVIRPRIERKIHSENGGEKLIQIPVVEPQNLPLCKYLGDEIEGKWVDQWWTPNNCQFKRYSQEEAKKCFKGRSIAFIGDSTSFGLWRDAPKIFGEGRLYVDDFDYDMAVKLRREGDPQVNKFSTRYYDDDKILLRFYDLWMPSMWSQIGYRNARDNQNRTIQDVLRNKTIDLVVLNIGAHVQNEPMIRLLNEYCTMLDEIKTFYNENWNSAPEIKGMAPFLWNTMNPNYPPKKPEKKRFQTMLYSEILNDLAYFHLGKASVPIIDFHGPMATGLPLTTDDGMHSTPWVNDMKNQMLLNFLCNSGTFNSKLLLGESYHNRVVSGKWKAV